MNPNNSASFSIIALTNLQELLYEYELKLRGQVRDQNGNIQQVSAPLMNEYGINSMIGFCSSYANRSAVLSNFTDDDVRQIMDYAIEVLAEDLVLQNDKYEIKNKEIRAVIYFNTLALLFTALKRGFMQGDKNFFSKTSHEIVSRVEGTRGEKKGLFSFMPWGK
jgi:hypothetical protein